MQHLLCHIRTYRKCPEYRGNSNVLRFGRVTWGEAPRQIIGDLVRKAIGGVTRKADHVLRAALIIANRLALAFPERCLGMRRGGKLKSREARDED